MVNTANHLRIFITTRKFDKQNHFRHVCWDQNKKSQHTVPFSMKMVGLTFAKHHHPKDPLSGLKNIFRQQFKMIIYIYTWSWPPLYQILEVAFTVTSQS